MLRHVREEHVRTGEDAEWEERVNEREIMTIDLRRLNEDLFAVLVDKTESEAYFRVKSAEPGNGIEAFVKISKWFMGTRGMGLQDKARQIMAPIPPKSEGTIADAVETWLEGPRIISNHKGHAVLRVTALKIFLIGRARD